MSASRWSPGNDGGCGPKHRTSIDMRNLDLSILWGHYGVLLLKGLLLTLQLAAWSLIFSVAIGLVFGVLRWARVPLARPICWLYLEVARTVPPLVQLLFWYFSAIYIFPTNV